MSNASQIEAINETSMQYLTIELAQEEYGIDILRVQEIRGWGGVRNVPDMPDYVKGVLNLRGILIPVLDLRVRFGMSQPEYTPMTVIVVVSVYSNGTEQLLGLVVDGVSDVLEAGSDDFKQPPNFGSDAKARFMLGMVARDDRMVIVLNTDEMLSGEELGELSEMGVNE